MLNVVEREGEMPDFLGDGFSRRKGLHYNYQCQLYDLLPYDMTFGTAMNYQREFPDFQEEMFFLLENATLHNANTELLISECQQIVDARNKEILDNFGTRTDPYECYVSPEELDYSSPDYGSDRDDDC